MKQFRYTQRDLRVLLFHEFRLGHRITDAVDNINQSMGKGVLSYPTAVRWFKQFKANDFEIEDRYRSGRPSQVDLDRLQVVIEEDPRQTTRRLADQFGVSHVTIIACLHELGKQWRYGVWIPHELTESQLDRRVDACIELLTSHRTFDWLSNVVTGDEKWVMYINNNHQRQWLSSGSKGVSIPLHELHPKKVMLSVWWGMRGVIHWELLPTGSTITANVYCKQLDRVAKALKGKQDKVYFLHDNAKPHIAKSTKKKLLTLNWTVLTHPPYSPDLAPSDYHLFRSMTHALKDERFENETQLKEFLDTFFKSKSAEFYERGIKSLPVRWQHVIDKEGRYIDE